MSAFFLAGWSCALGGTGFAPVTRAARSRCKSTADLTAPGSAVGLFTFHGFPPCRAASAQLAARGHVGPGSNRRRIGWSVTRAIMS